MPCAKAMDTSEVGSEIHHQHENHIDHNKLLTVPTSSGPSEPLSPMSESTFTCGCCYEIMVQPTTLNCGHSFCRLCLARWWKTQKRTTCPECRYPWTGFPHVNIILRKTMEKLCPVILEERSKAVMTSTSTEILAEFEQFGQQLEKTQAKGKGASNRTPRGFVWGVLTTLGVVFVIQLILNWGSSDNNMLVYKPLRTWKSEDVSQWLQELGSWAGNQYSQQFLEQSINGNLLMGLTEESQLKEEPFNIKNVLHRRAILAALERVKEQGAKPPRDLWEYKSLHRGLATFLLYVVKEFPRITISSMYIFYYEDVFLPFMHITCPGSQTVDVVEGLELPRKYNRSIEWDQWAEFIPKFVFLPYYLIAELSWAWIDVNFMPVIFILANCVFLTMIEAKTVRMIFKHGLKMVIPAIKKPLNTMLFILVSVIMWPLIPTILCDFAFYVSLYYSPCGNFYTIFFQ
ncbi:bifunctional apoptosis regulator-like [Acanthaster planci]|uniref:Bifunctional apoptosis regulator-like n=1 Tax=Acanthaster planci TaxID=133434 RepID=A0A8B7ZF64_ACAPL|nr:bifunctional apoptosis regulator-like [Acanthaster planci]